MIDKKNIVKINIELKGIVPGFVERRKREIPVINDYLVNRDFESLQMLGHRLKGDSGSYGFDQLGHLGSTLEVCAQAEDIVNTKKVLKEIEEYVLGLDIVYVDATL